MKKLWTMGLVAALAMAAMPAMSSVSTAKSMMPTCKGRMAKVNVKTKTYVVVNDTHQKTTKMTTTTVMCEATARAKGYHMMTVTKKTTIKMKTPAVNPGGAMNADKGASPNPENNANGIHTTAAPAPTPTP